ncbi:hypothetical protein EXIGLDRAFT_747701, partial [Exidia glandulosa HHB12029]
MNTSPGTPLGLFWQPLLDDYGRASNLMWRLADSVFFYVKESMNVDHGIDAQRYSWLLHVAGIENDQKISARVDNARAYFRDISIRYTTVTVNGTTMPALDRQNWFALMAWETQVTPDYAFRWWEALVNRLPLEDPQTKAPFPSPPPRHVFPEIGDPDLRPIAASFAALLSVVSPSGRDHERNAFTHPLRRSPTSSSVVASQRIMEALPGRPASVTVKGNASPGRFGGPPPLPPRPSQQPEASTSRPPPYSSPQRDREHRRTWSPGTSANDAPSISVTPKRHSTHVEAFNDAFPEPDSFFGVESMQSIVNRGLGRESGTPSRRPFSLSMMPVAAAEEARLRGELAEEALERPSAGRSTGWTILTPAGERGEPSQSDVEVKRRRRGSRIFSAF